MRFSNPLVPFCLAALLVACGGGDVNESQPTKLPSRLITMTRPDLTGDTPIIVGTTRQFDGGICAGGNGVLTAHWLYSDGPTGNPPNVHTFNREGNQSLLAFCTSSNGDPTDKHSLNLDVLPL